MAKRVVNRGPSILGGLIVGLGPGQGGRGAVGGSGTPAYIRSIRSYSATVTPTNPIPANSVDVQTVTLTGVKVGDAVVTIPPSNLEAGITSSSVVTAANTVTVKLNNPTGSGIATAAKTWTFVVFQLTA